MSLASGKRNRPQIGWLVAQGESVPGPVLQIGNTNSRHKFPIPAKDMMNRWNEAGPGHHCAIGVGHVAAKLAKLAKLQGIDFEQVC